jgi:hypothetical protein
MSGDGNGSHQQPGQVRSCTADGDSTQLIQSTVEAELAKGEGQPIVNIGAFHQPSGNCCSSAANGLTMAHESAADDITGKRCERCDVLSQQVQALAQALAGLGAGSLAWSACHDNSQSQRRSLAELVLKYATPCSHLDSGLQNLCSMLSATNWDSSQAQASTLPMIVNDVDSSASDRPYIQDILGSVEMMPCDDGVRANGSDRRCVQGDFLAKGALPGDNDVCTDSVQHFVHDLLHFVDEVPDFSEDVGDNIKRSGTEQTLQILEKEPARKEEELIQDEERRYSECLLHQHDAAPLPSLSHTERRWRRVVRRASRELPQPQSPGEGQGGRSNVGRCVQEVAPMVCQSHDPKSISPAIGSSSLRKKLGDVASRDDDLRTLSQAMDVTAGGSCRETKSALPATENQASPQLVFRGGAAVGMELSRALPTLSQDPCHCSNGATEAACQESLANEATNSSSDSAPRFVSGLVLPETAPCELAPSRTSAAQLSMPEISQVDGCAAVLPASYYATGASSEEVNLDMPAEHDNEGDNGDEGQDGSASSSVTDWIDHCEKKSGCQDHACLPFLDVDFLETRLANDDGKEPPPLCSGPRRHSIIDTEPDAEPASTDTQFFPDMMVVQHVGMRGHARRPSSSRQSQERLHSESCVGKQSLDTAVACKDTKGSVRLAAEACTQDPQSLQELVDFADEIVTGELMPCQDNFFFRKCRGHVLGDVLGYGHARS